jgi:uncharacterized membrane protein
MLGLIRGTAGHPSHPPITDVAIGCYTFATAAVLAEAFDIEADIASGAAYFALGLGILATLAAAFTGLLDYLSIPSGTRTKQVALYHGLVMVTGLVLFAAAFWQMRGTYDDGTIDPAATILTLVGFAVLGVGGWLGGTLVFRHGMRVERAAETDPAGASAADTHRMAG